MNHLVAPEVQLEEELKVRHKKLQESLVKVQALQLESGADGGAMKKCLEDFVTHSKSCWELIQLLKKGK